MADEKQASGDGAEATPKKKFSMLQIALVLQMLVILGATGVIVKSVLLTKRNVITKAAIGERAIASLRDQANKIKVLNLDEITVNLPDDRTLMAHVQLEVSNEEVEIALRKRMPAMKARLLDILGGESTRDASELQGKLLLKEKIRSALNSELDKSKWDPSKGIVREVFFVNLLLQ